MSEVHRRKKKKFDTKKKFGARKKRSELENEEIQTLEAKLAELSSQFQTDFEAFAKQVKKFTDFPLSAKTKKGLEDAKYLDPTEVQKCAILPGLIGCDVLGGAKTGSGKTLAFLIPILEKLYKEKWSRRDGLGALIISPTRELALQTFKVLKVVGKHHDFSADLVIGGKFLKEERDRINQTNIVVCTPGRLKQHLETTFNFRADNLHILVLDEADRILDLGFQQQMTEIAENLPQDRQTLLFSATQTRMVRDLAKISMRGKPVLAFTNDLRGQFTPTPVSLQQSYIVCPLSEKLDTLWSFVKNYLKSKIVIFFATCKQVRFVFEVFRRMRPGTTVLSLHSKMKYTKRLSMYDAFVRKQNAVLFATDIAARGLDFPAVDWVVHADCPVDTNTYIHRSGRTARCNKQGAALLILLPSEEQEMLKLLAGKNVPIRKIKVDRRKTFSIRKKVASLCAADVTLKEFAQRGFVAYLRSVVMAGNKKMFDVSKLNLEEYASSLGLACPPRVRFVPKGKEQSETKTTKLSNKVLAPPSSPDDKDEASGDETESSDRESDSGSSSDSSATSQNQAVKKDKVVTDSKSTARNYGKFSLDSDDDDDDFLKKKKEAVRDVELPDVSTTEVLPTGKMKPSKIKKTDSKYAVAKKILKKQLTVNTKIVFDDEGLPVEDQYRQLHSAVSGNRETAGDDESGINISVAKRQLEEEDKFDKKLFREKIQQKHRDKRLKQKMARREKRQQREAYEAASDDEPDVSFLPDPDKVYGRVDDEGDDGESDAESFDSAGYDDDADHNTGKSDNDSVGEEEEDEDDDDNARDASPVAKRRKLSSGNSRRSLVGRRDSGSSDEGDESEEVGFDTGLSLEDDEAIALRLLQTT